MADLGEASEGTEDLLVGGEGGVDLCGDGGELAEVAFEFGAVVAGGPQSLVEEDALELAVLAQGGGHSGATDGIAEGGEAARGGGERAAQVGGGGVDGGRGGCSGG